MKAVKGTYQNVSIKLFEKPSQQGPMEVLVVFPKPADDPWHEILNDPSPRPALAEWVKEVEEEAVAQGKVAS